MYSVNNIVIIFGQIVVVYNLKHWLLESGTSLNNEMNEVMRSTGSEGICE